MRLHEISESADSDTIRNIILQLDNWFYQYSGKVASANFDTLDIPKKYQRIPNESFRAIILNEKQVQHWLEGQPLQKTKYEAWTTGEDPTGYLGFIGRLHDWYALFFKRQHSPGDIILNIHDFGSDPKVRQVLEQMEDAGEVGEDASHLWNYSTNEPQAEVIVRSQPLNIGELVGIKSYKTHKSPLAGQVLPASHLQHISEK